MKFYAHTINGKPPSEWQRLEDHLVNVAKLAAEFSRPFGGEQWAFLAGLWHDWGKGSKAFQAYLRKMNDIEDEFAKYYKGRVDHSSFGSQYAFNNAGQAGKILAYCLAGHHSGLPNWVTDSEHGLKYRLHKKIEPVEIMPPRRHQAPRTVPLEHLDPKRFGFQVQFFIRMLFSCLVDADFLDTEEFISPQFTSFRRHYPSLEEIEKRFWGNFDRLRKSAPRTQVNSIREKILADCLRAAHKPPGLFTLTVPTGGGKTLCSMAFALKHAIAHGKSRVIYVIPFTSVIEQNAQVFRAMVGDDCVLEHHSNFVVDDTDWRTKLATENWDAPIVVTTNVQFFDSFYSNKTSKCRKLHSVANSVIIFDEVQTIPVEKILPCIEVLKELSANYGASIILCTATQPAIEENSDFPEGLAISKDREMIRDVPALFRSLKRTKETYLRVRSSEEVAEMIKNHEQVLCIASTRSQALEIFNTIKDEEGAFHLSGLMYPAHRSRKLNEIKRRLSQVGPSSCRVVSTQLIEAGVDIDFPVVYRSIAGLDSIAQAAGRCNREGKLECGHVYIFKPDKELPPGYFRQTAQCAERVINRYGGQWLDPDKVHEYFRDYYWVNRAKMDENNILNLCSCGSRGEIQFEEISNFRMIESPTQPIVIAIEEKAATLVDKLKYIEHPGHILKQLQSYSVQIYPYHMTVIRDWLVEPFPGLFVLYDRELYSEDTGLLLEGPEDEIYIL